MKVKYLARLVVAIAFTSAGFSLLVLAGSSDMLAHGGTGGLRFRLDCGDDGVLIGVRYSDTNSGRWLDSLQGECIQISNNSWVGQGSKTAKAGSVRYTYDNILRSSATCPHNTVIAGISGRYGWYVNRLWLRCRALEGMVSGTTSYSFVTGSTSSIYVFSSEAGDHSFNTESCPDNKPASGFHGRDGDYIDSIGLVCHTGATPKLHVSAPPSEVWAIPVGGARARQLRWTDQSTEEQGFRVEVSGPLHRKYAYGRVPQRTFDVSASAGVGTNINWVIPPDLAQGEYSVRVCARFERIPWTIDHGPSGGDQCTAPRRFRF